MNNLFEMTASFNVEWPLWIVKYTKHYIEYIAASQNFTADDYEVGKNGL